ncbi:succinate dehydrogenase, hydrophobic membrane anchor protein [uncultured Rhodospira sp.]|uniref:succinate dehydrogenase, hydrophobic membrane anchor protein n=1 Tax=uncultured Rhodospira sp. TaxID=1936189 RepID=UPI00262EAC2A|nr:succinate dehydrogenase, hydrophobic membrane anchor protein [uncultured Rhodospira sp.]
MDTKSRSMQSALGRARGLGSAKADAAGHWSAQRITAVALVPLALWFVFAAVIGNIDADHAAFRAWIAQPINATLMMLFIFTSFHHGALGMIVVLEDYVHAPGAKHITIMLAKMAAAAGGLFCAICVLTLALGG